MQTAKKLGFKKGDLVYTGAFPGILISQANSATPCIEVWGLEHECGSAYAHDLKPLDSNTFRDLVARLGHSWPLQAYDKGAQQVLKALDQDGAL